MTAPSAPGRLLTLPNLVSTSRLGLAVGFMATEAVAARVALLALASFSDFLDGWLARRTHAASRLGALVDPVFDRLFVLAVVVTYVAEGHLGAWQAVGLLFRDVLSLVGWFTARVVPWLRSVTFRARALGKVVTVVQLACFLAVLLWPAAVSPLVWAAFVLGTVASIDYTLMLWRERDRAVYDAGRPAAAERDP